MRGAVAWRCQHGRAPRGGEWGGAARGREIYGGRAERTAIRMRAGASRMRWLLPRVDGVRCARARGGGGVSDTYNSISPWDHGAP